MTKVIKLNINLYGLIYFIILIILIVCVLRETISGNFFDCIETASYQVHICNYSWSYFGLRIFGFIWVAITTWLMFDLIVLEDDF